MPKETSKPSFDKVFQASMDYGEAFQPLYWDAQIPFIKFPNEWEIKIRPPFAGATIRFSVRDPELSSNDDISVYLDCHKMLGGVDDTPYWEAYPIKGEAERFLLEDVKDLIECMKDEFKRRKEKNG